MGKGERLGVRFSVEDMKLIDRVSKRVGMWPATWVREIVILELIRQGERRSHSSNIKGRAR